MGASSNTPSHHQVERLLVETEKLNRTVDRIRDQLETAGLLLYVAGLVTVMAVVLSLVSRSAGS
jgi:hypothetical protein